MTDSDRTVRLVIRGRVQGVGFRAFVAESAWRCGARGWVRNRREGVVEALISGPASAVDGVIEACRRGPLGSRVAGVHIDEVDVGVIDETPPDGGFEIRSTV
jgi:acylphosphatase